MMVKISKLMVKIETILIVKLKFQGDFRKMRRCTRQVFTGPARWVLLLTLACLLPLAGCGDAEAEAEDRRLRGMALEAQGKFHEALWEYEEGLRGHVVSAALWYHAGYLYLSGGDHAGAHRRFKAGLRLDRECAPCAEGAGTAAFALGNVADALPFLERALRLEPSRAAARSNVAAALGKLAADVDSRYKP